MIGRVKRSWRQFAESEPGSRFQDRYRRRRRAEGGKLSLGRVLNVAGGLGLAVAGIAMVIFPGPGWITFFIGLGMVAGESLPLARFLDRVEVLLRALGRWAAETWKRLPWAGKALLVLAVLVCAAAVAYGAYLYLT